ncbi:fused MFS/spermidine synthase [Pseudorhodoplanes sp.]|uniref:fused MFS/spermidine synthase n=1 Tax=Pseudorhodoplanes sp. TaxID=1934341 RepID=UPI002BACEF57|nr:fused MFS/spermidine synthase [Pseudorhodoplanes sp.]HWV55663.1 fused MFS/spermidine synthase [Pseudorhodoplanes sp.]
MPATASRFRLLLVSYTAAIFVSAALLFVVQPLFAKLVLPKLGGTPAVWSVAMVFFQAMLLAGYAYAHALTRFMPGRSSIIVHLAVMIVAVIALPLGIAAGWGRPPASGQEFWLLGLFGVSIGLPFFALSANGPLLQAWFARTGHPQAKDPYFLYAASNVGSFLALLAYPFLIEPFTRLPQQTVGWTVGFYVLIVLIGLCGVLLVRSRNALPDVATEDAAPPTFRDALIWIALAAVPSALLIAITAHISTDVAAAPFLWVVPLALYLATFVIAFQSRPILPHRFVTFIAPIAIILLVVSLSLGAADQIVVLIALNLVGFFVLALMCHGELAQRRPPVRSLTSFYLCLSLGGVIGGIFAGLVAQHLFSWVAEYPILIVAAALCRPGLAWPRSKIEMAAWALLVAGVVFAFYAAFGWRYEFTDNAFNLWIAAILVLAFGFSHYVLTFAGFIAASLMFVVLFGADSGKRDFVRSFFGVHKVMEADGGQFRVLKHGTIEHGAQRIRDAHGRPVTGRPTPITYYHDLAPMVQGLNAAREKRGAPINVAVVGLGTGTLACQMKPGDQLTYYEIDPSVVRIAKDTRRFTFLSECAPDARIVVGDARLTLADARDGQYDVIIVDAFSSDAIPTHLLTREAMAIYKNKIKPDGMVLMHISNKHMTLTPVVAGIAGANDLVARANDSDEGYDDENHIFGSLVVAVARKDEDFGPLAKNPKWVEQEADEDEWVWTDDYSNVLGAILDKLRE